MWDYLFNNFWCLNTVTRWHLLSLSSFYPLIKSSIIESKLVKGKWKLKESRPTYCWVQSYCKEESRTSLHRLQIIIVKSSKRKKKKTLFKEQNQSCGLIKHHAFVVFAAFTFACLLNLTVSCHVSLLFHSFLHCI